MRHSDVVTIAGICAGRFLFGVRIPGHRITERLIYREFVIVLSGNQCGMQIRVGFVGGNSGDGLGVQKSE
jgi:hypothetical protein